MIHQKENENVERLLEALFSFRGYAKPKFFGSEITKGEFITLLAVKRLEDAKKTEKAEVHVSDVSANIDVAMPTATKNINMLASLGYLKKDFNKNDRRIVNVSLTKKGKEYLVNQYEAVKKRYAGLYEYLGEEKTNLLIGLLHDTVDYFKKECAQSGTVQKGEKVND